VITHPIVTGIVRLARTELFGDVTDSIGGNKKGRRLSLLLPKSDNETWVKINNTIADLAIHCLKGKWRDLHIRHIYMPIIDGDRVQQNGDPFSPECKGHYIIKTYCKHTPEIVDKDMQPITDPGEIYDGVYARVSLQFCSYTQNNKPGVNCLLGPIMKIADGTPFISFETPSAVEVFSDTTIPDVEFQPFPSEADTGSAEKSEPPVAQAVNALTEDNDSPPWLEADFKEMAKTVQGRAVRLDELKQMTEAKL